jgi:solute carrier family 25 (mitochondrial phosphate transporter), member 23/24/25/41
MQCETVSGGLHGNKLLIATARKLWHTGGIRAFYRGLPTGLIGMFPYSAIDMGSFEYIKNSVTNRTARIKGCHEDDAEPNSAMTAVIGGFSGALGASVVYPLNLLRTRLQAQGTVLHPKTYNGLWDVTVQTVKGEGYKGLYKGIAANLVKVVPSVSIVSYNVFEGMLI